jgi:molybdopterin-containing oxidoreductase family membrane subunit
MSDLVILDRRFIARGEERASTLKFMLCLAPWIAMLAFGIYAAGLCLSYGLNQTNMDNRFAFGLWIFADLSVIAMGAGAFFTGFLVYILKQEELKPVLNSAVVVGLVCYGHDQYGQREDQLDVKSAKQKEHKTDVSVFPSPSYAGIH